MATNSDITVIRTVVDLRAHISVWRSAGETIALVPTMGALHDGHMALVHRAQEIASKVCVTLFINPTQFGENEDLDTYPQNEDQDKALLSAAGIELLYAPHPSEMYDVAEATRISVEELGDCLEGAHRPGFFTGVATVVAKLLLQTLPDFALFGEKDFQQLQVIKRMVKDLSIPVVIEGVPCIREKNGLALSSRNTYLNTDERKIAPALYKTMNEMAENIRKNMSIKDSSTLAKASLLDAGFTSVDYLVACNSSDLSFITSLADVDTNKGRILGAAWLGKTRLIDNIAI
ncbi:MAG: pantoate--beta-alanine ligase [Rhodospirillales bacterium]|jgi:pantoate--beta-alanine ligase|nr:pantoate--beta-alanine ligase [Rhodospirillales bacterium]